MSGSDSLESLRRIGWRGDAVPVESRVGRVIAQHRNGYLVHDGTEEFRAQPAPKFLKRTVASEDRPAVGDFVVLSQANPPVIDSVLPRRSTLARAAAGERHTRQIIASNVDTVFVVMGLDGDFNLRRVDRYLALIEGSGARAVIVLTKRDKIDAETLAMRESELSGLKVETHIVNAKDSASVETLRAHLQLGDTAVLVGSSGAGKSTLTNTLLGVERQSTNTVREHDSRGRHTTTHRALIQLPGGACLIDTPGMREIKLTGDEDVTAAGFADIEALALQCRFGDCAHGNEPGCAVRAALESGALDAERWHSFLKLRDELSAASDLLETQLKRKAHARVANKSLGQRLRDKYGRR
ncbi:MAG TPA: ribosome small subunit-dependent GTPase A [Rudaea sp.]|jgi:ribosome biogenesis GTPase|nr:ribosome small subunit-dependent GTPase A [Rudaea sp.]